MRSALRRLPLLRIGLLRGVLRILRVRVLLLPVGVVLGVLPVRLAATGPARSAGSGAARTVLVPTVQNDDRYDDQDDGEGRDEDADDEPGTR